MFMRLVRFRFIWILGLFCPGSAHAYVELHAHLFMNEAMTWAFRGEFNGPLAAKSWKDGLSSQANPEALEASGIKIVVVTLYAHPLFTFDLRDSVRSQIRLAEEFVRTHPRWTIARSSNDARQAIESGKRVIVLALEGASGVIENEADLGEFVDRGAIRIVTPLHLSDDQFGGVAFLSGIKALASPLAWIKDLFSPARDNGIRVNPNGLSEKGRWLTHELVKRKVWVDLTHASDAAQRDITTILDETKQPHLFTHTVLRKYLGAERGLSLSQLEAVKKSNGMVGIIPSEEFLKGTPTEAIDCAHHPRGVFALAVHYNEVASVIGAERTVFGTDFNGAIHHLEPSLCPTGTVLDKEGFYHIGQVPELWKALKSAGGHVPTNASDAQVAAFLETWGRVDSPAPDTK